ncbi:cysteine synthase B [Gonapodya prolifera JEL478]|uniref:Cysteine synthase n=1 Tax=Gonapodya prolifera (strain JEL478) TaxID=1344416 RepID=A0A139AUP3_GONPJ|nr:cysteine synthase B [Gonapodya prolifera JEL478]|eukprot:KXS20460.1 cysteine synthase B [Gonapodya prolifera JEL478]
MRRTALARISSSVSACTARKTASAAAAASLPHQSSPSSPELRFPTIESTVGNTPLVRLQRLIPPPALRPDGTFGDPSSNIVLAKLEGNNPAGSVKDRPALSMINEAERKGLIKPGDNLIEATSGNTGIALAMAAAIKGYKLTLIMPSNQSQERRSAMAAYGAKFIDAPPGAMEIARDMAADMAKRGLGVVLDQFANTDNPLAHIRTTGPEIWDQTGGRVTHFVSSMGTTGTAMGTGQYLKGRNPDIQIVGLQPTEGSSIAGIRRWQPEYLPKIFDRARLDDVVDIDQREAEEMMRAMARTEGIFAGISSGGAISAALRVSAMSRNAVIVCIVCDRGDRYLSTGLFAPEAGTEDPHPVPLDQFPSAAARLMAYPGPHYILFSASPDPSREDGLEWCPDVRRAVPSIRQLVRERGGTLLEVRVGQRSEWKDQRHPLRQPGWGIEVKGVPALVRWRAARSGNDRWGRSIGKELEGLASEEEARRVAERFLEATQHDE